MEQENKKKLKNWVVIDSEVYEYTILPISVIKKKKQFICDHCDLSGRDRICVEICFLFGDSPRGCFKKKGRLID